MRHKKIELELINRFECNYIDDMQVFNRLAFLEVNFFLRLYFPTSWLIVHFQNDKMVAKSIVFTYEQNVRLQNIATLLFEYKKQQIMQKIYQYNSVNIDTKFKKLLLKLKQETHGETQ